MVVVFDILHTCYLQRRKMDCKMSGKWVECFQSFDWDWWEQIQGIDCVQ